MKRPSQLLGVAVLALAALLVACSSGDSKKEGSVPAGGPLSDTRASASATVQATADRSATTTARTSTPSGGQTQAAASTDCFQGLKSYRYNGSVKLNLPSGSGGQGLGDIKLSGSAVTPDRFQSKIDFGGQSYEVITVGNDVWAREGNGAWEKNPTDVTNFNFNPEDFCQTSPAALEKAGLKPTKEKINGVDALRYRIGKDDLDKLGSSFGGAAEAVTTLFDDLELGLWVTEKEHWPVRISLTADQKGSDTLSFGAEFNFSDFNKSDIKIEAPK